MNNYEPIVEIMSMPKKMDIDDLIDQFVEDLEFDALKHWAAILDVDYKEPPIDDMWPDWEAELRT